MVQAQATEAVSGALVDHVSDERHPRLRQQPADIEQAWVLYQRAVRWTDAWTLEAAEQAISQLQEATRLDPDFVRAYAAL